MKIILGVLWSSQLVHIESWLPRQRLYGRVTIVSEVSGMVSGEIVMYVPHHHKGVSLIYYLTNHLLHSNRVIR